MALLTTSWFINKQQSQNFPDVVFKTVKLHDFFSCANWEIDTVLPASIYFIGWATQCHNVDIIPLWKRMTLTIVLWLNTIIGHICLYSGFVKTKRQTSMLAKSNQWWHFTPLWCRAFIVPESKVNQRKVRQMIKEEGM